MNFPIHLIIDFAHTKLSEVEIAEKQFFSATDFPLKDADNEDIKGLFLEWLIYDYRQTNGNTFFIEYVLKNPDNLPVNKFSELEQIAKTHFYSEFEIKKIGSGYFDLEDIATAKTYRAYDKKGSDNAKYGKGLLRCRVANVNGRWYFVGANPIFLTMVYTSRMKKILRKDASIKFNVKDTVELLEKQNRQQPEVSPPILTQKEIAKKREELELCFNKAKNKYHTTMSFSQIKEEISQENGVNVLDFWQKLAKKGLSLEFIINEFLLMQNLWNYLPHKCLNNQSPADIYTKLKAATGQAEK